MGLKTVKGLLDHCKAAKNWKYVYGMKGAVLTESKYNYLKNTYGNMVWDSDKNKIGCICCDCSGLISSYTGILRGSSNYKATALETATISELKSNWSKYVGWGIWLQGHIGVVSDTVGYYYAMDGSARNWAHRPLKDNNWTHVIKLRDIDYNESTPSVPKQPTENIDVYYMVYTNGKWLDTVKNLEDYAGLDNKSVTAITLRSSKGYIKYRAHYNGRWGEFKTGNSVTSTSGYTGNGRDNIDGLQMKIENAPGYSVRYRVSLVGSSSYLPWVTNYDSTADGYAGIFGRSIDRVQIEIIKNK